MFRHILPNSLSPLIILTALTIPGYIITEAILGLPGAWACALRPTRARFFITSWGALMLEGQTAINAQPWMLLAPAICSFAGGAGVHLPG